MDLHGTVRCSCHWYRNFYGFIEDCSFLDCRQGPGSQQGTQCPFPHTSISTWMATAFHKCVGAPQQHPGGNYRTWTPTWDLLCKAQQGCWLNFNMCKPPCSVHSNKNLLTALPRSCHERFCLTGFWVLRNLLLWWCWWFTLSLWLYTKLP